MIPYRLLYPAILVFCCIGVYSVNNAAFDVLLAALFGLVGFVCIRLDCPPGAAAARLHPRPDAGGEPAPRPADLAWRPDRSSCTRPISLAFLIASALLLGFVLISTFTLGAARIGA